MTEMQKQFEEWAIGTKDAFGLPFFTMKNKQGKYFDHAAEISWQAWQASRAAVVVKLGQSQNTSFEEWQIYHEDEVKDELNRLGVSYE